MKCPRLVHTLICISSWCGVPARTGPAAAAFIAGLVLVAQCSAGADVGLKIVEAARSQVGRTVYYDPSYQTLDYPNGDVPMDRGVCTDVVIRALRQGLAMDLQQLVHQDMSRNFSKYPNNWGLKRPDRNIDHRRVPNLRTFLSRQGYALPSSRNPEDFRPGDLVTCTVPPNLPHIMIVSDKRNAAGHPLVIHNIGRGTREEDRLFEFNMTGRYRIRMKKPDPSFSAFFPAHAISESRH